MNFVQKRLWLVGVLVAGQLALNACQRQTETVTPKATTATRQQAIASDWTAIDADAWTISAKAPRHHMAGFVDNTVTNAIVEQGLVAAFYRDPATGRVCSLPANLVDRSLSFTYYSMNDKGIISFEEESSQPRAGEYRWVVVPKEAVQSANWNDYEAVKQVLRLTE